MKILITGITGRIGANLAKTLVEAGHEVRGLVWPQDRRIEKLANLPLDLVEGSLTKVDDVNQVVAGMEIICHLGAAFQGGGPFSNEDYFEINVRGTFNMLEAARQNSSLRQFIFASSDALYDKYIPGGMPDPIAEDKTTLAPSGMYSLTKGLGESICMGYYRTYNLPLTVLRFALVVAGDEILNYGQFYLNHWLKAYQNKTSPEAGAVYQKLQAEQSDQDKLVIARDENGRTYKKHIADVRDIILGFLAALDQPAAFGQIFQLAGPKPFTWAETIPYLAEKLGLSYIDLHLPEQTPTYYEFDLSKGKRLLDYQPQYDIFKMIDSAIAFRDGQEEEILPT